MKGGSSYLSQNDLRQHFGLGSNDKMDEVMVRWPNGQTEVLKNVAGDYIYTIVEGQGIKNKAALPPLEAPAAAGSAVVGGATIHGKSAHP